jgi:RNA polymerase sigma factor (sigma-70 family)
MSDDNNVSHWIDLVKEGDSVAAHELWHHYYDRLVRNTRQHLRGLNRGMTDEEDIVVSVFESFYRAAEQGRFPEMSQREDLWRLLLVMSARKIIDKRRHDQRQRRGAGEHVLSLQGGRSDDEALIQVIGDEPTPEMVLMMTESFERLLSHLGDGQLREIAVGKMEGFSNAELAIRFDCSERTIERRLHLIRETCQQELIDQDE